MEFEWREATIEDVVLINPSYTIKKGMPAKKVSMSDVEPFTRKIQSYSIENFTSGSKFKNGDTLFARITPCLENGKTAYVSILDNNEIGFGSTEFIVFRGKEGLTDNKFVYYLSISPGFRQNAIKSMTGSSGRQRAQVDAIAKWRFQLPPLEEQKEIAKMLSSLDDKIELNNAINKNLEEIAQALFKHWFIDFEFPNENGEPYKSSGGEFVESEIGLIPKGWSANTLGKICEIGTEYVRPYDKPDQIYEHYSIPAFDVAKFPVFELGMSIKSNKYKVQKNSILVSKLNPQTKRIWKPLCLSDYSICSTEFINYIPVNDNLHAYIYSLLNSDDFLRFMIRNTTGSTNSRQRVNPRSTLNYSFVFSGGEVEQMYSKTVEKMIAQIRINILQNQILANIRDTLLPKLMSGEIRVPVEQP